MDELDPLETSTDFVVPVVGEELNVRKELFAAGTIRLSKVVHETPEVVTENLISENIEIERMPMDVVIDVPPPVRMEGDVTVISVVEEVMVVTKQLRLKEELRMFKRRSVSEYRQEVTLRSEELVVERIDGNSPNPATKL